MKIVINENCNESQLFPFWKEFAIDNQGKFDRQAIFLICSDCCSVFVRKSHQEQKKR